VKKKGKLSGCCRRKAGAGFKFEQKALHFSFEKYPKTTEKEGEFQQCTR
jgi:hypothetical protein